MKTWPSVCFILESILLGLNLFPPAGSLGSTTRKALRSDGAGATQGPAGERTATDEDTETARLGASKNPQKSPREGADSGSVLRG